MCKHILNAQVAVRAPCCRQWFDCPECHAEKQPNHELAKTTEMVFACKKCKKVFRKDMTEYDGDSDEYCPRCDNHYVVPAVEKKQNPNEGVMLVERELMDARMKQQRVEDMFTDEEITKLDGWR